MNSLFVVTTSSASGPLDRLDFSPWRLSGTVVSPLLNDPASVATLGPAASALPYGAPPRAPVLSVKPRNTLAPHGAVVTLLREHAELEIGASLALVIGRSACKVAAADAMRFVAACTLVLDLGVPYPSHYRPNVRFKALDGSCLVGPRAVPIKCAGDVDAASLRVFVDGECVQVAAGPLQRPAARLIEDVSEFMSLHAGDLLLLGTRHGQPRVRAGQRFAVECEGIGRLEGSVVAEPTGTTA